MNAIIWRLASVGFCVVGLAMGSWLLTTIGLSYLALALMASSKR